MELRGIIFQILKIYSVFLFLRDPRRRPGHGVRHLHQDSAEVQTPLHPGPGGRGDAVHRRDPEQHQHHHLRPPATAGQLQTIINHD